MILLNAQTVRVEKQRDCYQNSMHMESPLGRCNLQEVVVHALVVLVQHVIIEVKNGISR